jgi:NTE family protein
MRNPFRLKIGLALGGGAARGLAHIGVLRALLRGGIPIHVISGTSMGAIIGGAYAAGGEIESVEERIRAVLSSDEFKKGRLKFLKETKKERSGLFFSVANLVRRGIFFGMSNLRPSFLSAEELATSLEAIVPETLIEELDLPYAAVALDIESAQEVLLCHGSLREAASASASIPGVLPPVRIKDRLLIDGGWVDKIPVLPAFMLGADVVIAVDISADLENARDYSKGVDIMVRANSIKDAALAGFSRRMADLIITPEVRHIHWADFGAYDRCIEAGDEAADAAVPRIRAMLRRERWLGWMRKNRGKKLAEIHLEAVNDRIHIE